MPRLDRPDEYDPDAADSSPWERCDGCGGEYDRADLDEDWLCVDCAEGLFA